MLVSTGKFRVDSVWVYSGIGVNTISQLLVVRAIADPLFSKVHFALGLVKEVNKVKLANLILC